MAFGAQNAADGKRDFILAERRAKLSASEQSALSAEGAEQMEVFIGKVQSVTVSRPDSGFFVAKMTLPKGELPPKIMVNGKPWLGRVFTVKGVSKSFLEKDRAGSEVECYGRWVVDPDWGVQFDATFVNEKLPNSPEALEAFLGGGKIHGLGPAYAKQIVNKWGVGAIEILDQEPSRLLEIPGIGEKRLELVVKSWKTYRGVYEIMSFMQMHGIGDSVGLRIYNSFGENAIRVIEQNPYALTSVPMVGFRTADKIARSLGVHAQAPFRIAAALKFILEEAGKSEGHTALPFSELANRAADMLELEGCEAVNAQIEQALQGGHLIERRLLVRDPPKGGWDQTVSHSVQRCISGKGFCNSEKRAAEELRRIVGAPRARKVSGEILTATIEDPERGLDESQKSAARNCFASNVTVITGGPGTGKTHTIKTVLGAAEKSGLKVMLTAPTGRAAKRMEEATGCKASTIHRLLAYSPDGGFKHNETNPLPADLFIVDESSMIDIWLLVAFLKAIESGSAVIFVGDVDQLPSVGAGNVLSDMIASGALGVCRLARIHRQAENSMIVTNAHKIIKRQYPELPSFDAGLDFGFIEATGNEAISQSICNLIRRLMAQGVKGDHIQVICAQKNTEVGTQELNRTLRPILNELHVESEVNLEDGSKIKFSVGDRVMQFRNNYDLEVFNGDVGTIARIDPENGVVEVDFDGRIVELGGAHLKDIRLAYAITIHKSQGTEHPVVIIPMSKSHQFMFTPNLFYTAVTRGKSRVYVVGEKQVILRTTTMVNRDFRYTGLKEELALAFKDSEDDGLFG